MDGTNNLPPLFEAQLELEDPNLIFIPSLDPENSNSFQSLISDLIEDIINMSSFIAHFISKKAENSEEVFTYRKEIEIHPDIIEMKADILSNIDHVIKESTIFCDSFENYSYLWLEDRNDFLKQFLTYGRPLTQEELDLVHAKDSLAPKKNPPSMEMFREQVC